jgi:tight adherence protein C
VNLTVVGATVGLGIGVGVVLMFMGLPVVRRPGLDDRLAPYLEQHRLMGAVGARTTLAGGIARRLSRRTASLLGGSEAVRLRLQRAGRSPDLEAFRAEQIVWAAAGLLIGGALAAMLWWRRSASAGGLVVLVLAAGVGAFVGRDWLLGREADRREQRILAEFPTIADLLALSVAAGEGPLAALERVVRTSAGELSGELRRTLADVRAGAALSEALGGLASRTGLAPLARFVDGVVVAVERGTPLADVLKAQAQDVREASRRALMETAGRKEIGMMVPVVFLVLPVTVLFAVYPGFAFMRLSL